MSAHLRALETAIGMAETALARREAPRREPRTSWHEEAERRYRAGETLREIGQAVGRGKDAVRAALVARGVPMRTRGGGQEKRDPAEARAHGQKGGLATLGRHGREFYREIGRKGWQNVIEEARLLPEALRSGLTQVPNVLLYGVMSRCSGGMWKALTYLCTLDSGEDVDLYELAFATGEEEEDLECDLRELVREGLIEQRITLPGDREVFWLRTGEED